MKKFVCVVCGYIHEGEMVWADEHRIGVAQGVDEQVVEELRANFVGECTEVGMYLAMSRQADREGYPEVAEAYKRIAFEEAEHAAKFAELLGEVVVADTGFGVGGKCAGGGNGCRRNGEGGVAQLQRREWSGSGLPCGV